MSKHEILIKLYKQNLTDIEIELNTGYSGSYIKRWRIKNKLPCITKDIQYDRTCLEHYIVEAWKNGNTPTEISRLFKVSINIIYKILSKNNLKSWNYGRQCNICNKPFVAHSKNQKRCLQCNKERLNYYIEAKRLRSSFFELMRINPDLAMKIKKEIENSIDNEYASIVLKNINKENMLNHTEGYKILIKSGGIIFENLISNDINKKLRNDRMSKTSKIHYFIYKHRSYGNFYVYYLDPLYLIENLNIETLEKCSQRFGLIDDLIDIKQKIFKQHKDYIMSEITNKNSKWFDWHNKTKLNNDIYNKVMEV